MERVVKCDDGKWWIVDWTDMMPLKGPFNTKREADAYHAQFDTVETDDAA